MRLRRPVLLAVPVLLGVWLAMVLGLQRWMVFPRYATQGVPGVRDNLPGLVELTRPTPEGDVEAWLLPGDGVSADAPGPAVIFAHGNAELIDYWPETLSEYRRMGMSVLLPEYRGYGRSAGSPSQAAITDDLVYFYDRLVERPDVDRSRVVFHGRSLGGGAACALAAHRIPRAMILTSTFTSIADMAKRYLLPRMFVLDPFDNEKVLRDLEVPVLLVHGRKDEIVPYGHALRLKQAARDARLITYEADHNDCPPDWQVFWRDIKTFLADTGAAPDTAHPGPQGRPETGAGP